MASSTKRSHDVTASEESRTEEPASKRSRQHSSKNRAHQNSHIDPTSGQKYVFSNLGDETSVPYDSDIECEDDSDAMAYLKSVRLEAAGIPSLLIAPKRQIGPQLPRGFQLPRPSADGDNPVDGIDNDDEEGEVGEEPEEQDEDRYMYDSGRGDFRGRYEDGAYIAQPDDFEEPEARVSQRRQRPGQRVEDDDDDEEQYDEYGERWDYDEEDGGDHHAGNDAHAEPDPQQAEAALHEAYLASLRSKYLSLRNILQTRPPPSAVAALPRTHGYNVAPFGPRTSVFAIWNQRLRNTDPLPAQVASMDREAVLRVLRVLLSGKFLRRGCELRERTSRWLWALLARLPDRGEMNHVEIGWVRDLGRRAVLMSRSLTEMAHLKEALEGEGQGAEWGDDEDDDEGGEEGDEEDEEAEQSTRDVGDSGATRQKEDGVTEALASSTDIADTVTTDAAKAPYTSNQADEAEDGEVAEEHDEEDAKSEPMDCSEDGEVAEGPQHSQEDLEAVRARVLARLDHADDSIESHDADHEAVVDQALDPVADAQLHARMNMRATLNMILTVAGEFYGQRDLLEFREPFTGM